MAATTDLVSAIANSAGKLFDFGRDIVDVASTKSRTYYERLLQQGAPTLQDWLAPYRTNYTSQSMIILYLMIGLLGILLVVLITTRKGKK